MESANDPIMIRAKFLAKHLDKHNVQSVTLMILYDLRIPLNYDGFDYLTLVIPEAFSRCSQIVAGEIYDAVGNHYDPKVDSKNMEAAIRDAIHAAWKIRLNDRWCCYFPEYMIQRRKTPTNVEFLAAIVYFIRLWQDCCSKEADYANV